MAILVVMLSSCGTAEKGTLAGSGNASKALVRDEVAGVAYELPRQWTEQPREDLINFFTSAVASGQSNAADHTDESEEDNAEPFALFGAGQFKSTFYDPSGGALRDAAVSTAQGFAEFFIPASANDPVRHDRATKVDGRPAWRADYSVKPDDSSELPATVTLIAIEASTPLYLVAVRTGSDESLVAVVERLFSTARLIPAGPATTSSTSA